jgi:hypothetical protein
VSETDPSGRRIAVEALLYGALVLAFGAAFVGWRVWREGPRVLSHAPHAQPREAPPPGADGR